MRAGRAVDTKNGFTLMELSIVLVIIGIGVGSILVGRTLIRSAEIRQVIQQYEQFNVAFNAFNLKYGCKPGDCTRVTEFGLDAASEGNGDGIVGQCSSYSGEPCSYGTNLSFGVVTGNTYYWEQLHFWYQLSAAGLIKETIPLPTSVPFYEIYGFRLGPPSTPPAKLEGYQLGWGVQGDLFFDKTLNRVDTIEQIHSHVFIMSNFSPARDPIFHSTNGGRNMGGLNAQDVFQMDSKMDDGKPVTGGMRAISFVWLLQTTSRLYTNDEDSGTGTRNFGCVNVIGALKPDDFKYNFTTESVADKENFCGAAFITSMH